MNSHNYSHPPNIGHPHEFAKTEPVVGKYNYYGKKYRFEIK